MLLSVAIFLGREIDRLKREVDWSSIKKKSVSQRSLKNKRYFRAEREAG